MNITRWWRGWRAGWLGRLLRVHSPSGHDLGTCWCQRRRRGRRSRIELDFDAAVERLHRDITMSVVSTSQPGPGCAEHGKVHRHRCASCGFEPLFTYLCSRAYVAPPCMACGETRWSASSTAGHDEEE